MGKILSSCFLCALIRNGFAQAPASPPSSQEFWQLPHYNTPNMPIDGDMHQRMIYSTHVKKNINLGTDTWYIEAHDSSTYVFTDPRGTIQRVNSYDTMYQFDALMGNATKSTHVTYNLDNKPMTAFSTWHLSSVTEQTMYE